MMDEVEHAFGNLLEQLSVCGTFEEFMEIERSLINTKLMLSKLLAQLDDQHKRQRNLVLFQRFTPEIQDLREKLIGQINWKITKFNDPSLVKYDESPNVNTIFKLHKNFQITQEKGGWAYGNRSTFELAPRLQTLKNVEFPPEEFVIMPLQQCEEVRRLALEYLQWVQL